MQRQLPPVAERRTEFARISSTPTGAARLADVKTIAFSSSPYTHRDLAAYAASDPLCSPANVRALKLPTAYAGDTLFT